MGRARTHEGEGYMRTCHRKLLVSTACKTNKHGNARASKGRVRAHGCKACAHTRYIHCKHLGSGTRHFTFVIAVACLGCRDFSESGSLDLAGRVEESARLYTCGAWLPTPRVVKTYVVWPIAHSHLGLPSSPGHVIPGPRALQLTQSVSSGPHLRTGACSETCFHRAMRVGKAIAHMQSAPLAAPSARRTPVSRDIANLVNVVFDFLFVMLLQC